VRHIVTIIKRRIVKIAIRVKRIHLEKEKGEASEFGKEKEGHI
jgi:hypothetical protein